MAMFAIDTYIQNNTTPNGIVSFEFIGNISNVNAAMAALGNIGQSAVALSLGIDYLYIVPYSEQRVARIGPNGRPVPIY